MHSINSHVHTVRRCGGTALLLAVLLVAGIELVRAEANTTPQNADFAAVPPFLVTSGVSPAGTGSASFLIAASRDHRLFFKAYNDYDDITGDGIPDTTYMQSFSYYGYFDPDKCYDYRRNDGRFIPRAFSPTDTLGAFTRNCSSVSNGRWSGNFLNWATSTRIDVVRKVLYGGKRSTDTDTQTILEQAHLPADGHAFAKYYRGRNVNRASTPANNRNEITTCRATISFDRLSHDDDNPPLMRWIGDDYRLWSSNERRQCTVREGDFFAAEMAGNRNDNDSSLSQIGAEDYDPETRDLLRDNGNRHNNNNLNDRVNIVMRILVCDSSLINGDNNENCKEYPSGSWKPVGVLQEYGESGETSFGLMTGTYGNNLRGGVLRRSLGDFSTEVDAGDGTFNALPAGVPGSIVKTFDALRVFGYYLGPQPNPNNTGRNRYAYEGNYEADGCGFLKNEYPNGFCRSWGNPFAEILFESINYLVGGTATAAFDTDDSEAYVRSGSFNVYGRGYNFATVPTLVSAQSDAGYLSDLQTLSFDDGTYVNDDLLPDDATAACSPVNVLAINSGLVDADSDNIPSSTTYTGGTLTRSTHIIAKTNEIGTREGISGNSWIVPYVDGSGDYLCRPRAVTNMATISGLCPEAPTTRGSYLSAGLAFHAHTTDLRTDVTGTQNIHLLAVELSAGVPRIDIPPGDPANIVFTILPGYVQYADDPNFPGTGQFMEFIIVQPHTEDSANPGEFTGRYFISYEDSVSGGDFDQDMWGILSYRFDSSANTVDVQTELMVFTSASTPHLFGFTILGSTQDGYHAYSGHSRSMFSNCSTPPSLQRDIAIYNGEQYRTGSNPVPACGQVTGADLDNNSVDDVLGCVSREGSSVDQWGTGGAITGRCDLSDPTSAPRQPGVPIGDSRLPPDWPQPVSHVFSASTTSAGVLERPLWYAAKYGGFRDSNNNNLPDLQSEWDASDIFGEPTPDGIPDNYFPISNPGQLPDAMVRVFEQGGAVQRTASGTAAAVVANERQGIGAVFQALFEPDFTDVNGTEVTWVGSLHALFIDAEGLLREDGNSNRRLDGYDVDPVVELGYDASSAETKVLRFSSSSANTFNQSGTTSVALNELAHVWNARDNLSGKTAPTIQRAYTSLSTTSRYIFTWVDEDTDGVVDNAEVKDFVPGNFRNANQYSSFNLDFASLPETSDPMLLPTAAEKIEIQVDRLVHYIRGEDASSSPSDTTDTISPPPPTRIRTADYDGDGTVEPLLLGDIVHSSPVSVTNPAENYDLLTGDTSYATFRNQYRNRRQVVYIGANDGMLHAFNAGFYDAASKQFGTQSPGGSETAHALGEELWAYIPNALLPYLQYLRDENYQHMYFVDGNPRIFDAKVFTADSTHPGGWGTLLVVGMRFGGTSTNNDFDVDQEGDGLTNPPDTDTADNRAFLSVYMVLDITNPEVAPTVLAEINVDGTYTTMRPGAVQIVDNSATTNKWFLLLGSGPVDLATGETSSSPPRNRAIVQVYDLAALVTGSTAPTPVRTFTLQNTPTEFIGGIVSSDYDLDLQAEAVYFGTVGPIAGDTGDLYRIAVAENETVSSWGTPLKLLAADKPFSARPTLAVDGEGNRWVYAGSGRMLAEDDNQSASQQTLYGFMDTNAVDNTTDANSVTAANLKDVTTATSLTDGRVDDPSNSDTVSFATFRERVAAAGGWRLNYRRDSGGINPSERSINPSSLLGEVLFNTAFAPPGAQTGAASSSCGSVDIGSSVLYGIDFLSGVPHTIGVFGQQDCSLAVCSATVQESLGRVDLGSGLASAPSLHLGQPDQNAPGRVTVVVQQSTGEIRTVEGQGVAPVTSQELNWREYAE